MSDEQRDEINNARYEYALRCQRNEDEIWAVSPGLVIDLIDQLRDERESRKQAEDKAFNAGIKAAHTACEEMFLPEGPLTDWERGHNFGVAQCRSAIRAIPQEPAGRERGK